MSRRVDEFRSVEDAFLPDSRFESQVVGDLGTGAFRPMTFADHHGVAARLGLAPQVPEVIRIAFDSARNVLLYAWCAYRLYQVAQLQALTTVELALKHRFGATSDGAGHRGNLVKRAIEEGLLRAEGFSFYRRASDVDDEARGERAAQEGAPESSTADAYLKRLLEVLRDQRNELAHGSDMLYPHGELVVMEVCRDLINQLYAVESTHGSGATGDSAS